MESDDEVLDKFNDGVAASSPFIFCQNLLSLQAQILSTCILTLASPFISPLSNLFRLGQEATPPPPARRLLWRIAAGLMAAAYVCMVLVTVAGVAAAAAVGLVGAWAEKAVYVRESLQFDYTHAHPTALFSFGNTPHLPLPVGHTLYVSLTLFMPDSEYNRDIGIFQVSAELISGQGNVIARWSRPSMLQFRSWPIRYMRTFVMGVPLLLGLTTEAQRIRFPILKHKEAGYPDVRITLIPRAGTSSLPHLYDAQLLLHSRPPWTKELLHNWRLTSYVWTTIYIFLLLLMLLLLFLRPLVLPVIMPTPLEPQEEEERDVSESLKRWQRSRSRRKAALGGGGGGVTTMDHGASSASSIVVSSREESGDSESVCS